MIQLLPYRVELRVVADRLTGARIAYLSDLPGFAHGDRRLRGAPPEWELSFSVAAADEAGAASWGSGACERLGLEVLAVQALRLPQVRAA